ncbi:MAG: helix-turn-helix transcriptional regulator [Clostridiales bacterium]|nr:helix-turn-helix transcriptional regulator [Clostridiales bacterium]
MYDKYDYIIKQDNSFIAGYKSFVVDTITMPSYLFTTLRILRAVKGSADWKIGNRIYTIHKGDIIIVNNIDVRRFTRVDSDDLFECEIFAFPPTIFSAENECLRLFYDRSPDFSPVIGNGLSYINEIHTLLDMLADVFRTSEQDSHSRVLATSLITAVSSQLMRGIDRDFPGTLGEIGQSSQLAAEVIEKTMRFINDNISKEFNVSDIAKYLNLSRSYFSLLFKRYTGTSPSAFINRCRVTNVIRLLNSTNKNVLEAAMASGFQSASGFYKTFHTICGMSPIEYIKLHTNSPI